VTLLCLFRKIMADMGYAVVGVHLVFRCEVTDKAIFAAKAIMAAKNLCAPNPQEASRQYLYLLKY